MKIFKVSILILFSIYSLVFSQERKKYYLANDEHTDYMWTADAETYRQAFLEMIEYYMDLAESTSTEISDHQSRFNCDGSFWMWTYEKNRTQAQFERFIQKVKSGHLSVPLTALVSCYGGVPAEAVIRGMYYAGKIEREYDLRFKMAVSMENQTLPYGLGALWAGSGAEYSWKGICGCASHIPDAWDREHDIYWWVGPDDSRILMKWNSLVTHSASDIGGYAEAMGPHDAIYLTESNQDFLNRWPYSIIGAFGHGGDYLKTTTDVFVQIAKSFTNDNRQVIVSNEIDFFEDFKSVYGEDLPSVSCSFGNEWDLYCASLAEVSATVKRALQKLRIAESMAAIITTIDPNLISINTQERDQAWMNLGLYWEHDWTADGPVGRDAREQWQRELTVQISAYAESLYQQVMQKFGGLVKNNSSGKRFYVFNSLGRQRTDYADILYTGANDIHVVDLETSSDTPFQIIQKDGQTYLRILATDIPSVGYKVYEIQNGQGEQFANTVSAGSNVLQNSYYSVTLSSSGAITNWIDKKNNNAELVQPGMTLNSLGQGSGSITIENAGPVSATLCVESGSPLAHTTRVTLFRDVDRVDIQNEITQNFSDVTTWDFNFNLSNPVLRHEEVGAVITAKYKSEGGQYSDRNARYDWLTLNHFANFYDGNMSVTLSNSDAYFMKLGTSTSSYLDAGASSISVLAGGQVDGGWFGIMGQGGDSYFLQRFALQSSNISLDKENMNFALEHQTPLVCGYVNNGTDLPEKKYSFLEIDNSNVLLWALKPADDAADDGVITRVWNMDNTPGQFSLYFPQHSISTAEQTTHIETPIKEIVSSGQTLISSIQQQQLKTLLIKLEESSLPIEFGSFQAVQENGFIYLNWKALDAGLTYGFAVEKSINGSFFEQIGFVYVDKDETQTSAFSYVDKNPASGKQYYRIKEINIDGTFSYSSVISIENMLPHTIVLRQNYPNPFNPTTIISFDIPASLDSTEKINSSLNIYNVQGRLVKSLADGYLQPASYFVEWDGTNQNNQTVSSGIYFYVLVHGNSRVVKQLLFLR